VADLVHGKHALPYLARAVSGTFDVDRCDYLLRDAHATGVLYGAYDLPWLLRSLRFNDSGPASRSAVGQSGATPNGAEGPGLAIDGTKGLAAIEAFLLARLFMFQQVYFHKSTRAAEWMIGAILRRAIGLIRDGVRLPSLPPAFASVAAFDTPSPGQYLELDDQVLLCTLHEWEGAADPVLSDLCKRIRARSLFKTIELFPERTQGTGNGGASSPEPAEALAIAREIAATAGLDPDVYVGLDVASDTPYAEDESLRVVFPKGRPRLPSEVSFLLDRLRNETVTRVRVIFAPELREAMREALIR
jgi:HD superfamily phosphohydrolase